MKLNGKSRIIISWYILSIFEQKGIVLGLNVANVGSRVPGNIIANLFGNFIERMVSPGARCISRMEAYLTRIKPDEFKEWNETMVKKYDPDAFHHHSNPLIRFVERRRVRAIVKLMDIHKDTRVLEIGCGAGNVIEKTSFEKLFGVDISSSILNKARRKLSNRAQLFQGDAQNLPCKDEVFKQVICSEVLEHLLSPPEALHEMARILESNGVAVISVPNELWINRIKSILVQLRIFRWFVNRTGGYREMPERMEDEWHLHTLSLEEWLNLFRRYFKVTRLRRIPFLWLPLRYVVRLEKLK